MGGGTLNKLVPGYKSRIFAALPEGTRRFLIGQWHRQYERRLREECLARPKGLLRYSALVNRFKPADDAQVPFVDYRRQIARGTYLPGTVAYFPSSEHKSLTSLPLEKPAFARDANTPGGDSTGAGSGGSTTGGDASQSRFYNVKLGLAALLASIALYDYGQSRPVVWCIIFDPCPPIQPWYYKWMFHSYDVRSIRRGFEVFRAVCSACHSLKKCRWWYLMKDVYPVRRVQEFAAEKTTIDGLTDEGELNIRPCMPWDYFPRPYPTKEAAEEANNGKEPPDFSEGPYFWRGGADYFFGVLTGYRDPPAGLKLIDGTWYNPWFPGGVIAMPPPLEDGLVEYEDGTPATVSQMAKDVINFLVFINDPLLNERKLFAIKGIFAVVVTLPLFWALRRMCVMGVWNRQVDFGKMKWI